MDDTSDGLPPAPRRRGLRTGFTTGTCAAAAAKAAALALTRQQPVGDVTIRLPIGQVVTFALKRCEFDAQVAVCSVVKDAGDDPDVTHGAEIVATVSRANRFALAGGEGVGIVTLPGLGLEVGGPAINPVPRQMIAASVAEITGEPLLVEISVPGGAQMAKKTLNGRLGILGGISILGTTGIVRPYSTASWRASVEQAVDVAAANGLTEVVLSTGGRSEKYGRALKPELPDLAFVEMGEFTGHAMKRCAARGIARATLAGMIGKLSKIAQGHFMTHVAANQVDPAFLAELAKQAGASAELADRVRSSNTARHAQEIAGSSIPRLFSLIAQRASGECAALVGGKV
ncbi:MAG: cobalt-precorrin-5B (C(1))-methyltransferase, partial [Chloroflexi bacterium]|nr:cobalt-precorrin-5B (C(1))-methyltransferase [Chloroflexota bacterium]